MRKSPISPIQFYLNVSENEEKMLRVIENTPGVISKDIKARVNVKSIPSLSRSLHSMLDAGYIDREKDGTRSRWFINKTSYANEILRVFAT